MRLSDPGITYDLPAKGKHYFRYDLAAILSYNPWEFSGWEIDKIRKKYQKLLREIRRMI